MHVTVSHAYWRLQIPDHHFIVYKNKTITFVSRNFMDRFAPATLDHIYKFLDQTDDFNCKVLCRIIQQQTGRLSEVHIFDALIGNNDRHGRNLGFITRSAGIRILSPFYDNPSYIGIADDNLLESDLQPRGTIHTAKSEEPVLRDYLEEFKRLGLKGAIDRFKQKATSRSKGIVEAIQSSPALSSRRRNALITLVEKKMQDLDNA